MQPKFGSSTSFLTLCKLKSIPMSTSFVYVWLGMRSKRKKIYVLTNHFNVNVVSLFYEDGHPVEAKGIGRKMIDSVQDTYNSELDKKHLAYDVEKSLFTVGSLPCNELEFIVVIDDVTSNSKTLEDGGVSEDLMEELDKAKFGVLIGQTIGDIKGRDSEATLPMVLHLRSCYSSALPTLTEVIEKVSCVCHPSTLVQKVKDKKNNSQDFLPIV
ncbi:hypothetical protein PTKIN_Ptkin07bG0081900 [Pterospermum kingtungense]